MHAFVYRGQAILLLCPILHVLCVRGKAHVFTCTVETVAVDVIHLYPVRRVHEKTVEENRFSINASNCIESISPSLGAPLELTHMLKVFIVHLGGLSICQIYFFHIADL